MATFVVFLVPGAIAAGMGALVGLFRGRTEQVTEK